VDVRPFAQAERSLARTQGGLGLGLSLVRGLVELHGGSVRAQSKGPNRGSEFVVRLPIAAVPSAAPAGNGAQQQDGTRTVLVIEDNLDSGQTLADVLALNGHRVQVATDGRSGIAKAREMKPDVILCDIGLPDVDGYEVARTLRADPALQATYLVALSGYAQEDDRRRATRAGFDAHLPKPSAIGDLLALLSTSR
jgi:CheY-like chemotaxis protein